MKNSIEYELISSVYGSRVAERSKVPLINHINEGLVVLDAIGASETAKKAYCIHPLVQGDEDLRTNYGLVSSSCHPSVVMLAMEYRNIANAFLSEKLDVPEIAKSVAEYKIARTARIIRLSPLTDVNEMLVADKVQNYKDFITYHKNTHHRSQQLTDYFDMWLSRLGITPEHFFRLCDSINEYKANKDLT